MKIVFFLLAFFALAPASYARTYFCTPVEALSLSVLEGKFESGKSYFDLLKNTTSPLPFSQIIADEEQGSVVLKGNLWQGVPWRTEVRGNSMMNAKFVGFEMGHKVGYILTIKTSASPLGFIYLDMGTFVAVTGKCD